MSKRLVNSKKLAEYLGSTESTIRTWTCLKKIPYVKVGRLVKFDLNDIDAWVNKNKVKPHPVWNE